MKNTQTTGYDGVAIFHKIIRDPKLIARIAPSFFNDGTPIKSIYEIIYKNPDIWNNITAKQVLALLSEIDSNVNPDIIENLFANSHSVEQYDPAWLQDKIDIRLKYSDMEAGLRSAVTDLKLIKDDVTLADLDKVADKIKTKVLKATTPVSDTKPWISPLDGVVPNNAIPLTTGYPRFDDWHAICKKRTTCFLGKTNGGKTISLLNIATGLIKNGYKVAYVSFEVEQSELLKRLLSQMTQVPTDTIENMTQEETIELWKKHCSQYKLPELFYDSYQSYTPDKLLGSILERETECGEKFDAIIVDYLSIIDTPEEDMYSKGKKISQAFANFSKSYNWAIVTAAQTNREGLKKIILSTSDIAESAAILHTFDFIISIIHYKKFIRAKHFAWDLIKARYVHNMNTIGSKTTFGTDWSIGGLFVETADEVNDELVRTIIKDDRDEIHPDQDDCEVNTVDRSNVKRTSSLSVELSLDDVLDSRSDVARDNMFKIKNK